MEYTIYYFKEYGGKTHSTHVEVDTEADARAWFEDTHPGCEIFSIIPTSEPIGVL